MILLEAKRRILDFEEQVASELLSENPVEPDILQPENPDRFQTFIGTTLSITKKLDTAIDNNITLKSTTDDLLLNISDGTSLQEDNQYYYLDALNAIGPLNLKIQLRLEISEKEERFNYCCVRKSKTLMEVDNMNLVEKRTDISALPKE